jgi:hypothetical protein
MIVVTSWLRICNERVSFKGVRMAIPNSTEWLKQIFKADIVRKDGIVRRKKSDVKKYASYGALLRMVKRYDFHLISTGEQYIVVCNKGSLKIHC